MIAAAILLFCYTSRSFIFAVIGSIIAFISVVTRSLKNGYTDKIKLLAICIYVLMLGMMYAVSYQGDRLSNKNANVIITACQEYKNEKGAYPKALDDLVPAYLKEFPKRGYSGTAEFKYNRSANGFTLRFTQILNPMGMLIYNSETNRWRTRAPN